MVYLPNVRLSLNQNTTSTFTTNDAKVLLMNKRKTLAIIRLGFGGLDIVAIIIQLIYLHRHNSLNLVNFFSYFTILSNVFAALVLIIGAIYLLRGQKPSKNQELIRTATVLYMTVTGIIYATLLSGLSLGLLMPWVNDVLHRIMPVVVVADWLYQPTKAKLRAKQIPWLLVFPIAFLVYTLIRGPSVNWYPYPFLNPSKAGGYAGVALYSLAILALFVILSRLMMYLGHRLKRHVS